jgi:deaminated glutathione amidase
LKFACLQISSTNNLDENLKMIEALIRKAVGAGAGFITTPENSCYLGAQSDDKIKAAFYEPDHPALPLFKNLAHELGVYISIGSLTIKISETRLINRLYLFNPAGEILAQYDKIHLFDVTLPNGDVYRESDLYDAGTRMVMADTAHGKIGLSICYDVRFPALYRHYAHSGAEILFIPAAFTVPTGEAHWHVLMRARAIENGCYVVAAAQTGTHAGGRKTYGHSVIIDPWGRVLADAGTDVGFIMADIDLKLVHETRAQIPSLKHGKIIEGQMV